MEAQPLCKEIYKKAQKLGITKIHLAFSGGSDEGYLNISFQDKNGKHVDYSDFNSEIEEWAWNVYDFSGAGDGNDYGDDIIYDLKNKAVETSDWAMVRQDGESSSDKLKIKN